MPLLEYHGAILHNDSELSVAERALIAADVSALNDCHFCFSADRDHAKAWDVPIEVFGQIHICPDYPFIDARLRPVLASVRRLTVDQAGAGLGNGDAIYEAGFTEEGLFDIISVTALYNFMNRVLEGAGIKRHVGVMDMTDEKRRKYNYTHLWKTISKGAPKLDQDDN